MKKKDWFILGVALVSGAIGVSIAVASSGATLRQGIIVFFAVFGMGWMGAVIVAYLIFPEKPKRSYPKPKPWDKDYES